MSDKRRGPGDRRDKRSTTPAYGTPAAPPGTPRTPVPDDELNALLMEYLLGDTRTAVPPANPASPGRGAPVHAPADQTRVDPPRSRGSGPSAPVRPPSSAAIPTVPSGPAGRPTGSPNRPPAVTVQGAPAPPVSTPTPGRGFFPSEGQRAQGSRREPVPSAHADPPEGGTDPDIAPNISDPWERPTIPRLSTAGVRGAQPAARPARSSSGPRNPESITPGLPSWDLSNDGPGEHDTTFHVPAGMEPDLDVPLSELPGPPTIQMTAVVPTALTTTALAPAPRLIEPSPQATSSSSLVVVDGTANRNEIAFRRITVSSEHGVVSRHDILPDQAPRHEDNIIAEEAIPLARSRSEQRIDSRMPSDKRLYLRTEPSSPRSAAFRTLCQSFMARGVPRVLAVSSPAKGEGKTTVAVNLALALVEQPDMRVLLVDVQHRTADLARAFRLRGPGDVQPSLGKRYVRPYDIVEIEEHLDVACLHPGPDGAIPTFDLRTFTTAIDAFREYDYDTIILDCDAVLSSTTTARVCESADAVLLVVSAGKTSAHQLSRAVEMVGKERVVGTVLSRA